MSLNTPVDARTERYKHRYNRGFLKNFIYNGQEETDKFIEQFYASQDYQSRLEAIRYLMTVEGRYSFPSKVFTDALKDLCSQVKLYMLQHYDFALGNTLKIQGCLVEIAKNDEKLQLRVLALEQLSELVPQRHYDLFFSTSLLKSSRESAAGLRGLYKLDKEKAYQMAKFRAENSSGNLDLAIGEIFQGEGDINDLVFFKLRLQARTKFNKIEFIRIYLKFLAKIENELIIKGHVHFICEDVLATATTEVIQLLIMELYHFISNHKDILDKYPKLSEFVNKTIKMLLEKNYRKLKR